MQTNESLPRVGERLSRLRRDNNMTQEALAEYLGVSRQAVSKWESDLTYPETDKLIRLARLYGCSVDYLLTGEETVKVEPNTGASEHKSPKKFDPYAYHFEYKSRRTVKGIPLVHVNFGLGRKAHGVIAIGLRARGIVSVGLLSMGVISFGVLSMGILALGALSLGVIALGSLAAGILALGGVALGLLAMGGVAVGLFAVGGVAYGYFMAFGDWAGGMIALGQSHAAGSLFSHDGTVPLDPSAVESLIDTHIPALFKWIARWILSVSRLS